MKITFAIPILLLFLITSCKKEDSLKGIDKSVLFASPTEAEIKDVENAWAKRDLNPKDVTIEQSHVINAQLSLHIISFRVAGIKEYAAALVPVSVQPLPIVFYVGGYGTDQERVNSAEIKLQATTQPFIYVLPSLRGQYVSIKIADSTYFSTLAEGARTDAFDGATDDVIASLNAIGGLFPQADTATAMIRGGSRGGTVALLAAERDPRFKRAAAVAFGADMMELTSSQYNDRTYKEQFLGGLINGTATIAETRRLMIASSPLYFSSTLHKAQLHCGQNDKVTPAAQGQKFFDRMKELGLQDRVELFIYPGREHNDIGTSNPEMETRINNFFAELW